jgi:hypothetical protein
MSQTYTYTRAGTLDFTDRNGITQTAPADTPARDFLPDGTFRGSKWTVDALAVFDDPISGYLRDAQGTVEWEVELTDPIASFYVADIEPVAVSAGRRLFRFTWDGTAQQLYIDGVLAGSGTGAIALDDIIELPGFAGLWWLNIRYSKFFEGA